MTTENVDLKVIKEIKAIAKVNAVASSGITQLIPPVRITHKKTEQTVTVPLIGNDDSKHYAGQVYCRELKNWINAGEFELAPQS